MKNQSSFEEIIAGAGNQPGLSESERTHMRASLKAYMGEHPALLPSPYQRFLHTTLAVFTRPAPAFIAALLILTVTVGGVAHAAENTLPGDALYPVKIDLLEPVQTALIFSSEAKTQWHITLAERRINEAATLAHQGRLNANTESMLATNFSQNASAVATSSTPSIIFDARLSAYENVLMKLDAKEGTSTTRVLQNAIYTKLAFDADNTPATVTVASVHMLRDAAATALDVSAHVMGANAASINATSSIQAKDSYQEAQTFSLEGDTFLSHNDTEGASHAFESVISTTAQLDVLTHAAAQFNIDAFTNTTSTAATSSLIIDDRHKSPPTPIASTTPSHMDTGSVSNSAVVAATSTVTAPVPPPTMAIKNPPTVTASTPPPVVVIPPSPVPAPIVTPHL